MPDPLTWDVVSMRAGSSARLLTSEPSLQTLLILMRWRLSLNPGLDETAQSVSPGTSPAQPHTAVFLDTNGSACLYIHDWAANSGPPASLLYPLNYFLTLMSPVS